MVILYYGRTASRNMAPLFASVLATLAVSALSLVGLATLSMREERLRSILFLLVSLAAGALFGDAFLHLIPEAFENAGAESASLAILGGIVTFFILEKLLRWHHSHGGEEFSPDHGIIHPVGHLVLISDGVHNVIDGVAIGAGFLVSPEVGIATALAVALHEIPQEIGDFGLLLHAGFTRAKALLFNFVSALFAVLGALAVFGLAEVLETSVPLIAAFSAGMFIYIAGSDLVPELHKTIGFKKGIIQLIVFLLGLGLMYGLLFLE